jgi:hypothetical protein
MSTRSLLLALAAFFIPSVSASAQEVPAYEVVADGTTYQANFTAATKNIKEFTVYFVSEGNNSSAVAVGLQAPNGTRATGQIGLLGERAAQDAAKDGSFGMEAKFRSSSSKKEFSEAVVEGDGGSAAMANSYTWLHLHKDACSGNKKTRYLAKVTVNVSQVDPSLYEQGFTVFVALQQYNFKGAQVASIKPSSDGKYFGEPILLMGTISYGNEYVNIRRYTKGGKLRSMKRIPIVKYVGYKGYGLSLARIKGLLNGGKATFELSNGGDIYGVCFSLVRKRQVRNGYPMSAG